MSRLSGALAIAALAALVGATAPSRASDHADTAENVNRIGADLTDVYIFPSATDPTKVVLATTLRSLIPTGMAANFSFDPGVLVQMKIDNSASPDYQEDLVIQFRFTGTGPGQQVRIAGPVAPTSTGTSNVALPPSGVVGTINQTFVPFAGAKAFAGAREDPFFIDLEQFYTIFPDRMTPLLPPPRTNDVSIPNPNAPQALSWRPPGQAEDFLAGINALACVIELPRAALGGGKIRMWVTTSPMQGGRFVQQERLARPLINEVLVTVSNNRHKVMNRITPQQDLVTLAGDVNSFLVFPAGRSLPIRNVLRSVLIPDTMTADLTSPDPASYLGVETNGATGGKFGGRALPDDVVDISLGAIFGTTVSDLGLAPPDGKEIPPLTSDNIGPGGRHFLNVFPYIGAPQ